MDYIKDIKTDILKANVVINSSKEFPTSNESNPVAGFDMNFKVKKGKEIVNSIGVPVVSKKQGTEFFNNLTRSVSEYFITEWEEIVTQYDLDIIKPETEIIKYTELFKYIENFQSYYNISYNYKGTEIYTEINSEDLIYHDTEFFIFVEENKVFNYNTYESEIIIDPGIPENILVSFFNK